MNSFISHLGYVRETWGHMSAVSGFDALFTALKAQHPAEVVDLPLPAEPPPPGTLTRMVAKLRRIAGLERSSSPAPSPFVGVRHEIAAVKVLRFLRDHPESLALLSAGENQLGATFCNAPEELQKRLIVCFHQPPSWHRLHWQQPDAYARLGSIVTLCEEQSDFFESLTDRPVLKIHHGVDLGFFTPGSVAPSVSPRLLFVGQWLRDFQTLADSMELIWQWRPDVTLDCVVPRGARNSDSHMRLARDQRVRWHAGISAETLRGLYQQATLLFLPIVDATANNAVIEALSAGLPIVSSNAGGLQDYLPAECGLLASPHCARSHADAVRKLIDTPAALAAARLHCREHATTHLDWQQIAKDLWRNLRHVAQCPDQAPASSVVAAAQTACA
ncbi:glycosyltransferase family 4 protein [Prosthecobacter sp.]|uniref:glycosyltransferase family 4 protein n=1 Tax=Prosthecobacter sp. TaxID=1965333 RepID=UPI003784A0C7